MWLWRRRCRAILVSVIFKIVNVVRRNILFSSFCRNIPTHFEFKKRERKQQTTDSLLAVTLWGVSPCTLMSSFSLTLARVLHSILSNFSKFLVHQRSLGLWLFKAYLARLLNALLLSNRNGCECRRLGIGFAGLVQHLNRELLTTNCDVRSGKVPGPFPNRTHFFTAAMWWGVVMCRL